jgi:hypothetical protein
MKTKYNLDLVAAMRLWSKYFCFLNYFPFLLTFLSEFINSFPTNSFHCFLLFTAVYSTHKALGFHGHLHSDSRDASTYLTVAKNYLELSSAELGCQYPEKLRITLQKIAQFRVSIQFMFPIQPKPDGKKNIYII